MKIETKFDAIPETMFFNIGTKLYMIPTQTNGLKHITEYKLLSIEYMAIGWRYHMAITKKEKGIEEFYCASENMFGDSILFTREEAEAKLKESI